MADNPMIEAQGPTVRFFFFALGSERKTKLTSLARGFCEFEEEYPKNYQFFSHLAKSSVVVPVLPPVDQRSKVGLLPLGAVDPLSTSFW